MAREEGITVNETVQSKLRERERQAFKAAKAALGGVLDTVGGRAFVYDIIFLRCGLMDVSPGGDASDLLRQEGRRSVGAALLSEVQRHFAERYVTMLREQLTGAAKAPPEE